MNHVGNSETTGPEGKTETRTRTKTRNPKLEPGTRNSKLETFLDTSTIYIIGAVVLLAIFILIGRLAVRWVVRLTMIGVILIALVGGAIFWWWTRSLSEKVPPAKPRATPAKRATNR